MKIAVILLIISIGLFFIQSDNWIPTNTEGEKSFMPNGFSGVMAAISSVFFAYIGFDALSVLSEETKNPQKNLPKGMIYSLFFSTIIYIALTLILSGIVDYKKFEGIGDPLAFIFAPGNANLPWMEFIVAITAIIAITSVLLVFQMGQPRIWLAMSRDGLLPKKFAKIHPKYRTPGFATIITGIVVGVPVLFTDKSFILDFTSIGTIFAFVLVNGGILLIPRKEKTPGRFQLPYINSKYIFPIILIFSLVGLHFWIPNFFHHLLEWSDPQLGEFRISVTIFILISIILAVFAFIKNLNLLPLMGLISCLYLLTGMTHDNWYWFGIWFIIGLVIYFVYGINNSLLNRKKI